MPTRFKINLVEIPKNQKLFLQNAKHKQEKKVKDWVQHDKKEEISDKK